MGRLKNVVQISEDMIGRMNVRYGMSFENVTDLIKNYSGKFELAAAAFRLGYLQGTKAECARRKEKVGS